jgi:hypothetical protein
VFSYNLDGQLGYVINLEITEASGSQDGPEACLSIPGVSCSTKPATCAASSISTGSPTPNAAPCCASSASAPGFQRLGSRAVVPS